MRSTEPPVLTARTPGEPEPDLTSLVLTHRAIKQDLGRLAATVAELAQSGSAPGREHAIRQYAADLLAQIRAHHRGEDEIVWPALAAAAGQAVDLAPLTDDHEAIEAALVRAGHALGQPGQPGRSGRPGQPGQSGRPGEPGESPLAAGELRQALGALRDMLDEHIADEERDVLPVMRRYLRAQTGVWCQRQACRVAAPGALRFRMPWLARHSHADEMSRVLAALGWRARITLVAGRPGYARLEHRAFGPELATLITEE